VLDLQVEAEGHQEGDLRDDLLQEDPLQDATYALGPTLPVPTMIAMPEAIVTLTFPSCELEKLPQMDSYNGTTDPDKHTENIEAVLTYRSV